MIITATGLAAESDNITIEKLGHRNNVININIIMVINATSNIKFFRFELVKVTVRWKYVFKPASVFRMVENTT